MNSTTIEDPRLQTHQSTYIRYVLDRLREHRGSSKYLTLVQAWDAWPTESTAYWRLLDREPYVTYGQKIPLPSVTSLDFREVHPKFVIAFLRAFELPQLTTLNFDYDIDYSHPDRRALLRMLVATARPLLAQLTSFRTSFEMHCHDHEAIAMLYEAIPNVTEIWLHYWGDSFECEEWWDVLRAQWEHVAEHPEVTPYLPRLRKLQVNGFSPTRLRSLLQLRESIDYPIREVQFAMGLIMQSEHDQLKEELDVFDCIEDITPDPVPSPPMRSRGLSNTSRGVNTQ